MPQKTDAVIAELMDRRLLNDVDPDLHQEIAKAVVKAVHTASLEGDAVERVARIIDPETFAKYDAELVKDRRAENGRRWADVCHGEAINRALAKARRILATGLVPDEATIRADKVMLLLKMIDAASGEIDATDDSESLLNYFCDDRGNDTDTFNLAIEQGLIRTSHNDIFETSRAFLTDAGRAAIRSGGGQ